MYPTAQFLASYEAGRGQRYYLFGTTASSADIVTYYRSQLMDGGDVRGVFGAAQRTRNAYRPS